MAADCKDDSKTKLIVNYLPQSYQDKQLYDLFATVGVIQACRIMRDFKTGYSYGYAFVTLANEEEAERAISTFNGLNLQGKRLKVSYARPSGEEIKDTNLYIANLPRHFGEQDLEQVFGVYGTIVQKNLLRDKITGMPRGVAFVRYDKKEEAQAAIDSMNGVEMEGSIQPLHVKLAEEHGKQKAAYYAGLQTGYALKQRAQVNFPPNRPPNFPQSRPSFPPTRPVNFPTRPARGRGGPHNRFNPMGRGRGGGGGGGFQFYNQPNNMNNLNMF